MKKLVVLTGAGISAESGISTFRDANGLWEGHDIMEVASPEGWKANPQLVTNFYNVRRAQLKTVVPNNAHTILVELEKYYHVTIITQNVDDLHERAGSSNIIHLHGELNKVRPENNDNVILNWEGDLCDTDTYKGAKLRPHIVWFGEAVPLLNKAAEIAMEADVFLIIGTSLQVYPAASLYEYVKQHCSIIYIDNNPAEIALNNKRIETISNTASKGLELIKEKLTKMA